jgi:hypothetical protein
MVSPLGIPQSASFFFAGVAMRFSLFPVFSIPTFNTRDKILWLRFYRYNKGHEDEKNMRAH